MLVLTAKHVVADFFLQTSWMALGKDRSTGWALPLLAHCAIHGVMTTFLVAIVQPKLWFVGPLDFAIHICIDRAKGLSVSTFGIYAGAPMVLVVDRNRSGITPPHWIFSLNFYRGEQLSVHIQRLKLPMRVRIKNTHSDS